jgi:hypothetical protein
MVMDMGTSHARTREAEMEELNSELLRKRARLNEVLSRK